MLVFENDGKIYAPIKEIASYLGYESYNGEYSQRSEEQSKCYIQNETCEEIARYIFEYIKSSKISVYNEKTLKGTNCL